MNRNIVTHIWSLIRFWNINYSKHSSREESHANRILADASKPKGLQMKSECAILCCGHEARTGSSQLRVRQTPALAMEEH